MKILIIRLSSFGDIVLSFPLINALKNLYPDCRIDFIAKKQYAPLLELMPEIDNIIEFDENISGLKKRIRNEIYDYIYDLQKNINSLRLTGLFGKNVSRYKKENLKKYILVVTKINLFNKVIPVFQKYMNVSGLIPETKKKFTTSGLTFESNRVVKEKYYVVAPSSKHFTKTFPQESYCEIINNIGKFVEMQNTGKNLDYEDHKAVLIGDSGENDMRICADIENKSKNAINLCGKLNLSQLANLIFYSDFVICNDSGIMHLSESLGKKVFAFFGSSVREFGFYPQAASSQVFENNDLNCRPCSHIGRESCPKGHFKCMNNIKVFEN